MDLRSLFEISSVYSKIIGKFRESAIIHVDSSFSFSGLILFLNTLKSVSYFLAGIAHFRVQVLEVGPQPRVLGMRAKFSICKGNTIHI